MLSSKLSHNFYKNIIKIQVNYEIWNKKYIRNDRNILELYEEKSINVTKRFLSFSFAFTFLKINYNDF